MITCQHCETWILDDQHRCNRCGRRVRSTPFCSGSSAYPITVTAAAPDYAFHADPLAQTLSGEMPVTEQKQLRLNQAAPNVRVIPFDSLTREAERASLRARAGGQSRPAPLKTETVQMKRVRVGHGSRQRKVEFLGKAEVLTAPQSHIICDAPVAPAALRLEAAAIDAALVAVPCALCIGLFLYLHGTTGLIKQNLPFLLMALATVPLLYKLLWTFAGCDTIGMRRAGLRLIDFDGNPPSQKRRYLRSFGSMLSFLAAGIGLIWSLVDEDRLTWHDHISGTFPTISSDE
jgi:uncharacterized RDD family membrane protein YckC